MNITRWKNAGGKKERKIEMDDRTLKLVRSRQEAKAKAGFKS